MTAGQDRTNWLIGLAEIGGGFDLGWLRFDSWFVEPLPGYEREILIRADLLHPDSDCFPNDKDRVILDDMEDEIRRLASDDAVFVGSLTEGGTRTFILYGRNRLEWLEAWRRARTDARQRRIIFTVSEEPDWPTHKALLPLAESAQTNTTIFGYLIEHGAHLELERRIDWTIRFASEEAAVVANAKLPDPYRTEVYCSGQSEEWCVTASLTTVATAEFIARMDARMKGFAKTHDGVYDGWGAEIQP